MTLLLRTISIKNGNRYLVIVKYSCLLSQSEHIYQWQINLDIILLNVCPILNIECWSVTGNIYFTWTVNRNTITNDFLFSTQHSDKWMTLSADGSWLVVHQFSSGSFILSENRLLEVQGKFIKGQRNWSILEIWRRTRGMVAGQIDPKIC